ncbi:MAG: GspH/FimT family pseudopilin [Planctomycetota bacterium]
MRITPDRRRDRVDRQSADRRAGFSLIELMGVIIILGLIGTVAVVSWQALLPGARMNAGIRNLSEVLASARSEAIARNSVFEIWYDFDAHKYWVRTPYRVGGGLANVGEEDQHAIMDETLLPEWGLELLQVTIDEETYTEADGQVYVRFDPLGASSAHTVVLHHPMFDSYFTLEVLPLTGEIRFHPDQIYEREPPRDGAFD